MDKIWVWVNTYRYIFSGMNIHLPAILMFTRGTRFWHTAICNPLLWLLWRLILSISTHAWVALVRGDETWLGNASMDMYPLVMTNIAMENPLWMEVLMGKTWKIIYKWAIYTMAMLNSQRVSGQIISKRSNFSSQPCLKNWRWTAPRSGSVSFSLTCFGIVTYFPVN